MMLMQFRPQGRDQSRGMRGSDLQLLQPPWTPSRPLTEGTPP